MPRAPHSMAVLAGHPRATRSVLASNMPFCRSTPCNSAIGTRETLGTGSSRAGEGCQTKASAAPRLGRAGGGGARRSRAAAIRSRESISRGSVAGVSMRALE